MAFTQEDEQVKGLMKDNGWDAQRAIDWANRYYTKAAAAPPPQAAANTAAAVGPVADNINDQSKNAQTYSATPGAAPLANTTNQGTQDVVRNKYLQQATQGTTIDPNDPNIKQQVEPFAAAQERAKRDYISQAAERLSAKGLGDSGQLRQEERLASENAGQATGAFQSQLIGRELQNRRAEIQNALSSLSGLITADQERELKQQLADLDATLRREGYSTQSGIAGMEDRTRMTLGQGALNIDLLKALLQNQQFGQGQAFNWANFDWTTNPMNPANWQ